MRTKGGKALLRDPAQSSQAARNAVLVPARIVSQYNLVEGAAVTGEVRKGKNGPILSTVESVCGLGPQQFQQRTLYTDLTAIDPCQRFDLGATGETSMRLVDLVAPIGKGSRALIVSPPKAGKTMLLEQIGKAIRASAQNTRIIVFLIDERPEEVTYFRRAIQAEVFASSSDKSLKEHTELTELLIAHIRTELECGHDTVVLVDSLTRMARAFNLAGGNRTRARGRTLSGGLEAGALVIPRRFFGLARNIEHGGSVTIVATALIETGSRMDQLIYEEFKGTGNSEIVLDRSLAQAYIFPAINILASSTRKTERLYSSQDTQRLNLLRRGLANRQPKEALLALMQLVKETSNNKELLQSIPLSDN
jgi:transcription termination factor Rho